MTYGIDDYARLVADSAAPRRGGTDVRGTAVVSNGQAMVLIDGADEPTPCGTTVTVNDGDRVICRIAGHRAVITGNQGSPAVDAKKASHIESLAIQASVDAAQAKQAQRCVEQTADGVTVGNKVGDAWVGGKVVISDADVSVVDASGEVAAVFSWEGVRCGECWMKVRDDEEANELNVFSGLGQMTLSASVYGAAQDGTAGSSLKARPPCVRLSTNAIDMEVEYLVTGSDGVSGKDVVSMHMDATGTYFKGPLVANGKVMG